MSKKGILKVFLKGGHVVILHNVHKVNFEMKSEGGFASYQIIYQEGREHPFVVFSLPDIVAAVFE